MLRDAQNVLQDAKAEQEEGLRAHDNRHRPAP